jgi:tetratricopeptide (TPR) repeat protein
MSEYIKNLILHRDFKAIAGFTLFFLFLGIYAYTSSPTIAPYRDTGEMVCDVATLGIGHQPGYPLYILLAKVVTSLIPLANLAYKLNFFSAITGAGALYIFYLLLIRFVPARIAFFACALFGLNFTLHTISTVSEMYSLNIFLVAILIYTSFNIFEKYSFKKIILLSYLLGLFMTNRMDILLVSPALGVLLLPKVLTDLKTDFIKKVLLATAFFTLGFSLYLYLLVRSNANPLFDWSHPADIATFLAVITRKSYGSTLDLISKNYSLGELFLPNMKYYFIHLFSNFNFALLLIPFGLYKFYLVSKERFYSILTLFLITGPLFLFWANMPPNPHSLAVVEPNYVVPDIAILFWIAFGVFYFYELKIKKYIILASLILISSISYTAFYNLQKSNRRWLFFASDYAQDVFKSVPLGGTIVAKKDVQLFSLWYLQNIKHKRPDIKVIAQGLSGARWYQDSYKIWHEGFSPLNLKSGDILNWSDMAEMSGKNMFITMDVSLPDIAPNIPRGMITEIYPSRKYQAENSNLWYFFDLGWVGEPYNDFFALDLANSYIQAVVGLSAYLNSQSKMDEAIKDKLYMSRLVDSSNAQTYLYLGFYYIAKKDWETGKKYFKQAAIANDSLLNLAEEYHSLEGAITAVSNASAYCWLNYGVALEKTGVYEEAEKAYLKALIRNPAFAQAHYNMAILYWRKDTNRVIEELKATLAINPNHKEATYYLNQMRRK